MIEWASTYLPPAPLAASLDECYAEREAIIAADLEGEPWEVDQRASELAHARGYTHGGEVTILVGDRRVAKSWRREGDGWSGTSYPRIRTWLVYRVEVGNLDELARELRRVAAFGRACVVRGEPLGDYSETPVRRLTRPDGDDEPTFRAYSDGLRWICVDVDGVPTDHDPVHDPDAYAEDARRALPAELRGGRCYYQLSASAGVRSGARVHFWYWLSRRANDAALRAWAASHEAIDASLFGAVQPHYVVAPEFRALRESGWGTEVLPDLLPKRDGWLMGTDEVWPEGLLDVPAWRAEREREAQERARVSELRDVLRTQGQRDWERGALYSQRGNQRALEASVQEIERAGAGGRNATICRRAHFMGRVLARGVLSEHEVVAALERAAEVALGAEWSSRGAATRASIARCIASGMSEGADE